MDIIFDFKGDPIGGKLVNYLLEKSRVVYQQLGERNFHSFYNLLFGASEKDLSSIFSLKSSDVSNYLYVNQGGNHKTPQIDDKQNYALVNEAMKVVNFDPAQINTIWSIVAAVIHLGNVKFDMSESDLNNNQNSRKSNNEATLSSDSSQAIKTIAKLLRVGEQELREALTSRLITTGKDMVRKVLSIKEALYAKDAFAKAMYEQLFAWIFIKINQVLDIKNTINQNSNGYQSKANNVIGVLDIYGFEIFDANG